MENQGRDSLPVNRGSDLAPQASCLLVQQFQDLLRVKLGAGQVHGNGHQQPRRIGCRDDGNHMQGLEPFVTAVAQDQVQRVRHLPAQLLGLPALVVALESWLVASEEAHVFGADLPGQREAWLARTFIGCHGCSQPKEMAHRCAEIE